MVAFLYRDFFLMQADFLARRFFSSPSPLVPVAVPCRREVHFWYILPDEVQNASLLNQYLDILSPSERENVFCVEGDKLKKRALLARTLVRTTLARYLILLKPFPFGHKSFMIKDTNSQVSPRSLKFKSNNFGKPEVDWHLEKNWDPPSLQFNISHTSSLIGCGVTICKPVGIDVEEKQRKMMNNILAFARRYFSSHEVEFLHTFTDPEIQRQEFIKLWTLKEAYVKALGRGFWAAPFKDFSIQFRGSKGMQVLEDSSSDTRAQIVLQVSGDPENLTSNWQFALFELENSHYAAICTQRDDNIQDEEGSSLRLKAWKTIPFVEDRCVSGTDEVVGISGLARV